MESEEQYLERILALLTAKSEVTAVSKLEELSKHRLYEVRLAVIDNKQTPPHVLQRLVKDRSVKVSEAAETRTQIL